METIGIYLLKMGICSAVLLGYYWFALRNERFHHWNRFYLLVAMFLSVVVPLLNIPISLANGPTALTNIVAALPWNLEIISNEGVMSWQTLVYLSSGVISLMLLITFLLSFIRILSLNKKHMHVKLENVQLILTNEENAPFSFFKWLFWRAEIDPNSENGQRILQHELGHINQKHSIDKILTELLLVFFWMNPFFWILKKELYSIHEFLADQKAISNSDGAAFANMILQVVYAGPTPSLVNPFYNLQLKRRLVMITKHHQPKYTYARRISGLVLMISMAIIMMFTIEFAQAQKSDGKTQKSDVQKKDPEQMPQFPGGQDAWRRYLSTVLRYPEAAQNAGAQGPVKIEFIVHENGDISNVKALNDPGYGLAEEAERIIKKSPKWIPAVLDGKNVTANTSITITFRLE
jgi:TonB family protein